MTYLLCFFGGFFGSFFTSEWEEVQIRIAICFGHKIDFHSFVSRDGMMVICNVN